MQGMAVNNSPAAQTISPPFLTSLPGTSSSTNILSKSPVRHLPPRRKVFEISCFSGLFRTEVSGYTVWKPEARPGDLTNGKFFRPRQCVSGCSVVFGIQLSRGCVVMKARSGATGTWAASFVALRVRCAPLPSASAAALTTHPLDSGLPETNEQPIIFAQLSSHFFVNIFALTVPPQTDTIEMPRFPHINTETFL